tara:strand:- start:231 stop:932 length:702 start_codon:yes stop_codon:yes gene_type:complete
VKVNAIVELFVAELSETPVVVELIVIVGFILSNVQLNSDAAVLLLPTESVNVLAETLIVVAPEFVGVKVAVYVVPLPEKLLNEPFDTVISSTTKFDVDLLELKVNAIVASFVLVPSETVVELIVMVGFTLSYVQLNSDVAVLLLPAISVNAPPTTLIVADEYVDVGVKVAVYIVPLPVKLLKEPPDAVISSTIKFDVTLLEVKVRFIDESFVIDPSETPLVVELIVMVGDTLS